MNAENCPLCAGTSCKFRDMLEKPLGSLDLVYAYERLSGSVCVEKSELLTEFESRYSEAKKEVPGGDDNPDIAKMFGG